MYKIIIIICLMLKSFTIFCQFNCQTLKRPDGTIIQCAPDMVSSDTETEIGLAIATSGEQKYLTIMVRFLGSAKEVKGEITIWLEDET